MWDNSTEDKNEGSIDHSRLKVPIKCQRWLPLTWITVNQMTCRAYVCECEYVRIFFNKHWRANFAVYNHVWGRGRGYVCVKIENNNHFVVICSCSNRWRISETYCLHTKEQHTHKLLDKHVQCGYAYTYTAVSTLFWFYFCFCLWVCVDLILNPNFTCNMPKRWHTLTHSKKVKVVLGGLENNHLQTNIIKIWEDGSNFTVFELPKPNHSTILQSSSSEQRAMAILKWTMAKSKAHKPSSKLFIITFRWKFPSDVRRTRRRNVAENRIIFWYFHVFIFAMVLGISWKLVDSKVQFVVVVVGVVGVVAIIIVIVLIGKERERDSISWTISRMERA